MADTKISALTAATTPLAGTEVLPIVQSSTTVKVSVANLTAGRSVSADSLSLTNALTAANGGTGQSSYTIGDILYASGATALSKLADVATGNALISGGVGVAPSWGKIGLTTHVSGTLAVTNGGTGLATVAQGDLLYGSASNTLSALAKNTTATRYLANTGTSNNPAWAQIDLSNGVTGTLGTSNGGTGLTSFTSGGVVYASSTSALTTASTFKYNGTNLYIGTPASADQTGLEVSNTDYGTAGTRRIYFYLGASNMNVNTTNLGGYGYSSSLTFANTRFNGSAYVLRDALTLDDDSNAYFPNIGTTASAANAYLDSGSSPANNLLRSTSSVRYKTQVEDVEPNRADAILNFRPVWYRSLCENDRKDWSWYGLIAEEVAQIEPRLVHWSYKEDDYEITLAEKERERITGQDAEGKDIVEKYIQLEEVKTLKDGAKKVPDGVQYDRLSVLLLKKLQDQQKTIDDLTSRLVALETK